MAANRDFGIENYNFMCEMCEMCEIKTACFVLLLRKSWLEFSISWLVMLLLTFI